MEEPLERPLANARTPLTPFVAALLARVSMPLTALLPTWAPADSAELAPPVNMPKKLPRPSLALVARPPTKPPTPLTIAVPISPALVPRFPSNSPIPSIRPWTTFRPTSAIIVDGD